MSALAKDVRDWLNTVLEAEPKATVGVDEGGLCLEVPETGDSYEIGGIPEEDDDEEE